MPIYSIVAPNGRTYSIEGPDGATQADVIAEILRRDPSAGTPAPAPAPKERTMGEAVTDVGAGLTKGLGNLVQLPGQLYGLATGDFSDTGALGLGRKIEAAGEGMKSEGLKAREAERQRAVQAASEEGQIEAFKTSFLETVKDPALLSSFVAEQLPQLLPIILSGGAAAGLTAGRASAAALAKGATKKAAAEAAKAAALKAGTTAAIQTGAVMQGTDVGAGTYDAIYQNVLERTNDPQKAAEAALNRARAAGVAGYGLSVLANRYLPGGQALEKALVGKGTGAGIVKAGAIGAVKEIPSENVEELGGALARNIALKDVDPTQSLTQGLGETAAQATLGATALGGVAGAYGGRGQAAVPTPPQDARVATPEPPAEPEITDDEDGPDTLDKLKSAEDLAARLEAQGKTIEASEMREGIAKTRARIERTQSAAQKQAAEQQAQQALGSIDTMDYATMAKTKAALEAGPKSGAATQAIKVLTNRMQADSAARIEDLRRGETQAKESALGQADPDLFGMVYPPAPEPQVQEEVEPSPLEMQDPRQIGLFEAEQARKSAFAKAEPDLFGNVYPKPKAPRAAVDPEVRPSLKADALQMPLDLRQPPTPRVRKPKAAVEPQAPGPVEPTAEASVVEPAPEVSFDVETPLTAEEVQAAGAPADFVGRTRMDLLMQASDDPAFAESPGVATLLGAEPVTVPEGATDATTDAPRSEPTTTAGGRVRSQPAATAPALEPSVGALERAWGGSQPADATGAGAPDGSGVVDLPGEPGVDDGAQGTATPALTEPQAAPTPRNAFEVPKQSVFTREVAEDRPGRRVVKGTRYRVADAQDAPKKPISDAELRRTVSQITKSLGLPEDGITILDDVRQFDTSQRPGSRSGVVSDGQVYLFRSGINSGVEGQKTIFHELLHRGLRNLIPMNEYVVQMDRLYRQFPQLREASAEWLTDAQNQADVAKYPDAMQWAIATEESMAIMAEGRMPPTMLRRLGNWLANIAARLGLNGLARNIRTMGMTELEAFIDDALRASKPIKVKGAEAVRYRNARKADEAFEPGLVRSMAVPDYKSREKLVDMPIADFLALAQEGRDTNKLNNARRLLESGSQFNSLPFLMVDANGRVDGHEGRHRAQALAERGYTSMPVILRMANLRWSEQSNPDSFDYREDWPKTIQAQVGATNPEFRLPFPVPREAAMRPYDGAGTRYRTAKPTTPAAQQVNTMLTALNMQPKPQVSRIQQAQAVLGNAAQNPTASAQAFKQAGSNWVDRVGNAAFSSNFTFNAKVRAAVQGSINQNPAAMGMLLSISDSQVDGSAVLAGLFAREGNLEYDPTIYKFKAVKATSLADIAKTISDMAKTHGLTPEQASQVVDSYFEARRTESLLQRNDEIELDAQAMEAVGFKQRAEKHRKLKVEHLKDPAWVAQAMQFAQMFPELQTVADQWNAVRANTAKIMVDSGLWTQEQSDEMLSAAEYVPFYREEQLEAGKGPKEFISGLQVKAKEARLRGSERAVNDIFDNMMRWTQYAIERSVRNHMAVQRMDVALDLGMAKEEGFDARGENLVKIWRDGVQRVYRMEDPLLVDAFAGLESIALPSLKFWAKITNMFRQSIVLNPLFGMLQVPQDAIAAIYTSGLKPRYAFTVPARAVKEFLNTLLTPESSRVHRELRALGAVGARDTTADVVRMDLEIMEGARSQLGFSGALWRGTMKLLHHVAMASDSAVRQAVYTAAMDQGLSQAEAVEKAFQLINFRNRGTSQGLAAAARVIPFLNAYLAAQHVAYKTLTGAGISPTDRKAALQTLAVTTAGMMTLATIYAMTVAGDEGYEKRPGYVRDRVFVIPGTGGLSIPMRADIFAFPKVIAEHMWHHITESGTVDGANTRRSLRDLLASSFIGPYAPQAFKPAVEVAINYDFFRQRPLAGAGLAKTEKEYQFTDASSELAKVLGRAGVLSPIEIDHLIRGYLGSLGGLILYGTNDIIGLATGNPRPDMPLWDAIATFPGASTLLPKQNDSAARQDFYELKEAVDRVAQTITLLNGRNPDELEAYLEDPKVEARDWLSKEVNQIYRAIAEIRKDISVVRNDRTLTPAQKEQAIKELQAEELEILQEIDIKQLRKEAQL